MAHFSRYQRLLSQLPRLASSRIRISRIDPARRWMLGALALLLIGVVATFVGARALARSQAESSHSAFRLASNQVVANFNLEIAHETDLLFAEAAFLHQSPSMAPAEFWRWAQDDRVKQRFPELVGIGELRLIPRAQLPAWIRRLSERPPSQGQPRAATRVLPGGVRPYYCLTVASVADDPAGATGEAFDACAATGNLLSTRASGAMASYALDVPGGIPIYGEALPVYRTKRPPATAAQRERAFIGWVGVAVNPRRLLSGALIGYPQLHVALRRGDGIGIRLASGPLPKHRETMVIQLADGMTAAISGPVKPAAILATSEAALILLGGLTTSLLLAVLVLTLGTGRERARAKVAEKTVELEFQALHDPLSKLPNRALLYDRAAHALARARRSDTVTAALFVDVDGFKNVNDTLGHAAGDELIKLVSDRLSSLIRDADTVGRFGGDEFVVLLEPPVTAAMAVVVAERILDIMRQPVTLGRGQELTVSVSIGIAAGQHESADALLHQADLALYAAKQAGKNRYAEYEDAMQATVTDRRAVELDLRSALANGEMFLAYQPIFELEHGAMVGVEALLRWQHPKRGLVPPGEFVPFAEQSGDIVQIGLWVMREACIRAAAWQRPGRDLHTAVNVSARQLDTTSFVEDVRAVISETGLDPRLLTLELTETALMRNHEAGAARLRELRSVGVRIAIDDFGTGYSSLASLRELPVDSLKIDRSFTAGIGSSTDAAALMRALVELGRTLGLETVGEGIEEVSELEQLRDAGCNLGQGFLLARPTTADGIDELLHDRYGAEDRGDAADPVRRGR
jgi:diguanylate cyclase (GGDEF)-like protein